MEKAFSMNKLLSSMHSTLNILLFGLYYPVLAWSKFHKDTDVKPYLFYTNFNWTATKIMYCISSYSHWCLLTRENLLHAAEKVIPK